MTINCSRFRFLIQQRFDYNLSQQENLTINQHLNSCPACSRFQHQIEQVIQSSSTMPVLEEYCPANIEILCEKIMQEMPKTKLGFLDLLKNLITGKNKKQLPENSQQANLKKWLPGKSSLGKSPESPFKSVDYNPATPPVSLNQSWSVDLPNQQQQSPVFTDIPHQQIQEQSQFKPEESNVPPAIWEDTDSLLTQLSQSKQQTTKHEYNQPTSVPENISSSEQKQESLWPSPSNAPSQASSPDRWNTAAVNPTDSLSSQQDHLEKASSETVNAWNKYQEDVRQEPAQPPQETDNQSNIISRLSSILGSISIDEDKKNQQSPSVIQDAGSPVLESPARLSQDTPEETTIYQYTDNTTAPNAPAISSKDFLTPALKQEQNIFTHKPISKISQIKQKNVFTNLQEPHQPITTKKQEREPFPKPFSAKAKLTASAHKLLKKLDDKEIDKLFRSLVVKGTHLVGETISQKTSPVNEKTFVNNITPTSKTPSLEHSQEFPQEQIYATQEFSNAINNNSSYKQPESSSPATTTQEGNILQQETQALNREQAPPSAKPKSRAILPPKLPIPGARKNVTSPDTFDKKVPPDLSAMITPSQSEARQTSKAHKQQDISSSKPFKIDDATIDKIFERLGIKDNTIISVPKINVSDAVNTVRTTAITTGAIQAPTSIEGVGKLAMPQASEDTANSGKIGSLGKFLLDQQDQKQISTLSNTNFRDTRIKVLTLEAANQLYQLLSHITTIPSVIGSCIVGHDGIAIANNLPQESDPELVGALSLGIYHNTTTILKKLSCNHLFQLIAKSPYGYLIIADFGGGILITVSNENSSEQLILIVKTIAQLVSI